MTNKKPSRLFSFRVTADLAEQIDQAVKISGKDKSAWLLAAVLEKLGNPSTSLSPESRIEVLIGHIEVLLMRSGAAVENNPHLTREPSKNKILEAKDVIKDMVDESRRFGTQSSNKRIITRLNYLGIKPDRGLREQLV